MSTVSVLVGNPKPRSRTYQAAVLVAEKLGGKPPDLVVDLVDLGAALLDGADVDVASTVAAVQSSSLVVVASPTYKATYTGLLKLFLDRIGTGALAGVTAVPLMLGGDMRHSLAPEVFLKPVLVELGASCPTPGLFLPESDYAGSEALDAWVDRARPLVRFEA
ncbi:MAG TPA: NAD(P)H-dependent oxidoreductase [Acidimicrobiales bacterium]|nr:NAD(P)H-dependent oxidoreductase [Acidimicrobiales bacterium]